MAREPITDADKSLTAFSNARDELLAWSTKELNEADTRAKLIDRVLGILGWDEMMIRRERQTADGEYVDYTLESATNKLILEAKRQGAYFSIPSRGSSRKARRGGILTHSPTLHKALEQVVSYCRTEHVLVGAVTNGLQYGITFAYLPHGTRSYDTILFDGIDDILTNYLLFWNLLSRFGSAEQHLRLTLSQMDYIRTPPVAMQRPLDSARLPDEVIDRNPVDISIAPIIRQYFSDLVGSDRTEVLKNAYVETGRQARYGKEFDELLADAVPFGNAPVTEMETSKTEAPILDAALTVMESANRTYPQAAEENVLILIGGVGAGKTSFAHRYFQFLISDKFRDSLIPVFLDLKTANEDIDNLSDFTDPQVLNALEEGCPELRLSEWPMLQRIYEREIARMRNGYLQPLWESNRGRFWELAAEELRNEMANKEKHVARVIAHIQRVGKQVCIIFDNADQLSQDFQRRVIKSAFQKSVTWRCLAMLAIREETYWRYRSTPPLDAFHRHIYHIAAPRVTNVLAARLELARTERGSESITVRSARGLEWGGISLGGFLQIIIDSFLGRHKENVMLLEALCANNLRLALEMFSTFLMSGHTNTDEYIKQYVLSGEHVVPFHSVLRSIALGDYRYYEASRSRIDNLFSLSNDGYYSHFQKIRILRYLQGSRNLIAAPGAGFVDISTVADAFQGLIIDEAALRSTLAPMLNHRLIEAANGYRVEANDADLVRITSAGDYYLSTLISEFSYLDLVAFDTVIKSSVWLSKINASSFAGGGPLELINERLAKVELFIEYLLSEELEEQDYVGALGLPTHVTAPIMPDIQQGFPKRRQAISGQAAKYGKDRPRGKPSSQTE